MKKIFDLLSGATRADVLLVAATVVAALRLMLINAVFIGFDIKFWSWFAVAEVWSGIAFALLEGLALAYVSKRWRRLKPAELTEWVYWTILLVGQVILLGSIVWVTAMAATVIRLGVSIDGYLGTGLAEIWSMLVTALNPLIVILIGIVEDDKMESVKAETKPFARLVRLAQVQGILERWEQEHGQRTPTVQWVVEEYNRLLDEELPPNDADEAIVSWRSERGISGRRPAEPGARAIVVIENGRGQVGNDE